MHRISCRRILGHRSPLPRAARSARCWAAGIATCLLLSCQDDPAPAGEPGGPPVVSLSYIALNVSSAHDLHIASKEAYAYELRTTGTDPYVYTAALKDALPADSVVLTFDYQADEEIAGLQVFLCDPVTEERSVQAGTVSRTYAWRTFSFDLGDAIGRLGWGAAGDRLRLDFGGKSGIGLAVRNIRLRGRTAEEQTESDREAEQKRRDELMETDLKRYLETDFPARVEEVACDGTTVSVQGSFPEGEGSYFLCEIPPYDDVTMSETLALRTPVESSPFRLTLDRHVSRDGFLYDRALSKWAIVRADGETQTLVSHGRYADRVEPYASPMPEKPTGKKGLGGVCEHPDFDDLEIRNSAVNLLLSTFMTTRPGADALVHSYGGKEYYFDRGQIQWLDNSLISAQRRGIVVAAILLIAPRDQCPDPRIGELLAHPDHRAPAHFVMPNMTTLESVQCYAAGLDFMAKRYCGNDFSHGRIHHWIVHNEVDMASDWTNMGAGRPMGVVTDAYVKSLRMCYNVIRQYDPEAEMFASFAHSWAVPVASGYYAARDMLDLLKAYGRAEGDFRWALAYHSYPEDLNEPKTWQDRQATFSMDSPMVTFKNLEVIDHWIRQPENMYRGAIKRSLWLSENGTNSRSYEERDLLEQAGGLAYAWKKLQRLDGIDVMIWHNWMDAREEFGLRIGLRRFADDEEDPLGRKPVWFLYQAAGTPSENEMFEPFKEMIGISEWEEIMHPLSEL